MRNRDWFYTYNHLDDVPMQNPDPVKFPVEFDLYDDDGNLYLTGRMTQNFFDSVFVLDPLDYAEGNWGCTEMRVNGVTI